MTPRRRGLAAKVAWSLTVLLAMTLLSIGQEIVRYGIGRLAAVVLLMAAAYRIGRRRGLRELRQRSHELPEHLADELAWYRRSLAELEHLAGRPLSAIIASYRLIHSRYDR